MGTVTDITWAPLLPVPLVALAGLLLAGFLVFGLVRGMPGMRIEVGEDGTVFLDGARASMAKTHALDGRPLRAIAPGIIPPGHFYLHADHADSHDSRYAEIGLVQRGRILGRAIAMPDIPWLGLEGPLVGPEDVGEAGRATILPHPLDDGAAAPAAELPQ